MDNETKWTEPTTMREARITLDAIFRVIGGFLATLSILSVIGAVGYIAFLGGVKKGRSDFHKELINELDAKGGAPVLLYPPDAMALGE